MVRVNRKDLTVKRGRAWPWLTTGALVLAAVQSPAQIAVSANDGKQHSAGNKQDALSADSVTILNLNPKVKVLATLEVPASMIGPPASVTVARDSSYAIVTASQQLNGDTLSPADTVSVVDLRKPASPSVAQTLHAGAGASGVAISPSGSTALVTNAGADTISLFSVKDRRLTRVGNYPVPEKSKPLDVAFADEHTAYVVAQTANALFKVDVKPDGVSVTQNIPLGVQPYSLALDVKHGAAFVTNLGGRDASSGPGLKMGTVAIVDLKDGRMREQVDVGPVPEHVALSPKGDFLQATLINGSNTASGSPTYHEHGSMVIFAIGSHGELKRVAQTETGGWCQGATWSDDEKRVYLQCAVAKQIEVYHFDGHQLQQDASQTVQLEARGGAIATARSR